MTGAINLGIIGAGRIGRVHAGNLVSRIPGANLVAVADVVQEAAEKLAADFQIPKVFQDYRHILDDKTIEAVLVCSSTETHSEMVIAAAAVGKHVFCEKPIDFHLGRVDRVLSEVEQAGVKLQIGFNRRFDSDFRRVRDVVSNGDIGVPHIVRITSRDPEPPAMTYIKDSGGMFLDMTIHDFDMARFLIDSEVDEVFAAGGVMVNPQIREFGDIDTAIITLRYSNGVIGAIDNSLCCLLAPLIISGMSSFTYPSCFIPEGAPTFFISLINSLGRLSAVGLLMALPFNNSATLMCFSGLTSYVN